MCVCVCVCVRERERETETERQTETERDSELELPTVRLSHSSACAGTSTLLINNPPSERVVVPLQGKRSALVIVCPACPIHSPPSTALLWPGRRALLSAPAALCQLAGVWRERREGGCLSPTPFSLRPPPGRHSRQPSSLSPALTALCRHCLPTPGPFSLGDGHDVRWHWSLRAS